MSKNYVCVREGKDVKRILKTEAQELVATGKAEYVPRSVWKTEVRDAGKAEATESAPKKRKGNPKGKARKARKSTD